MTYAKQHATKVLNWLAQRKEIALLNRYGLVMNKAAKVMFVGSNWYAGKKTISTINIPYIQGTRVHVLPLTLYELIIRRHENEM